jgi:glycosyltransferase involved in cell wall biosynthesis
MPATAASRDAQAATAFKQIGFCWALGTHSGWGTYALNFAVECARRHVAPAIFWSEKDLVLTEEQAALIGEPLKDVARWNAMLRQGPTTLDFPFLHALGDNLEFLYPTQDMKGKPDVGVIFFETEGFTKENVARAGRFDLIIAGSTWNKEVLERQGLKRVAFCPQGVDVARFTPRPRQNSFAGRFTVFSGGKLELRKGQDITVAAFKRFHARHPEALLVTAWNSPWPQVAQSVAMSDHVTGAPAIGEAGDLEVPQWLVANGLAADSFVTLRILPNAVVPDLLKEMDLAVFPNRCEGGTNLAAMECMAMGVPVVLSRNTGHRDLIRDGNCYTLDQQKSVGAIMNRPELADWGESSVDELVERMEQAYSNRADAAARAMAARNFIKSWDWSHQVGLCLEAIRKI